MEKRKLYSMTVLPKPYREGWTATHVAHLSCIPKFYANDAASSGYVNIREIEDDLELVENNKCYFCDKE
jgi:hypothetical protein